MVLHLVAELSVLVSRPPPQTKIGRKEEWVTILVVGDGQTAKQVFKLRTIDVSLANLQWLKKNQIGLATRPQNYKHLPASSLDITGGTR